MHFKRPFYCLATVVVLINIGVHAKTLPDSASFPDDFSWGVASAAYQVEGAWNVSDKGPSIWDVYTHIPGVTHNNETGDEADKFYDYYLRDAQMMKDLGIKNFRISLSWPRLLPQGTVDQPSTAGLTFYTNVINALLDQGIEPWVTLYHWDLPATLSDNTTTGGWLNPNTSDLFNAYADYCFNNFGGKVKRWLTMNEITSFAWIGYGLGIHAPGRCSSDIIPTCNSVGGQGNSSTEPYIVAHHAILAHAKAVQTYNQKYRDTQKGTIGFTIDSDWVLPWNPNDPADIAAVETYAIFNYARYIDPIITGDYPELMREYIGERLPTFTDEKRSF